MYKFEYNNLWKINYYSQELKKLKIVDNIRGIEIIINVYDYDFNKNEFIVE